MKQFKQEPRSSVERMSTYIEIRCKGTGRLLARANEHGPELFCRMHNTSHSITWEEWEQVRKAITTGKTEPIYWLDT